MLLCVSLRAVSLRAEWPVEALRVPEAALGATIAGEAANTQQMRGAIVGMRAAIYRIINFALNHTAVLTSIVECERQRSRAQTSARSDANYVRTTAQSLLQSQCSLIQPAS